MITQIGHTAFRARDIDKSVAFYTKLGLREAFRLHREDGSLWLVYLHVAGDQFVELFPGATVPTELTPASIGYAHLCLLVDDIHRTVEDLEASGITLDRPIKLGLDGNYQAWIVDPDGNRIELMQIMPDSLQMQFIKRSSGASSSG